MVNVTKENFIEVRERLERTLYDVMPNVASRQTCVAISVWLRCFARGTPCNTLEDRMVQAVWYLSLQLGL
jgi:hypothetical protein